MPRLSRKSLDTVFHHVMVQGINKEHIFPNDFFIEQYLDYIQNKLSTSDLKLLAYCIMNNHAHFLIFCEQISSLSKFMQKLNTTYSRFYNKYNNRVGFVFRDRFLSQPITSINQLLNCLVYIHNNPVKANLVSSPIEYKFSSYKEFINKRKIISEDSIDLLFENNKNFAEQFSSIHNKSKTIDNNDFYDIKEQNVIDFINEFEKEHNVSKEEIHKDKLLLSLLIKEARSLTNTTCTELAGLLQISKTTVAKYSKNFS